ncbi:MAG: hypothetical protein KGI89_17440, partial [Euryarchaeota archaeon]|nr:hypothetical protein [Euryarchaeota archaeon]
STGMGKKYGFQIEEILLVCHGSDHNDTICMAERRHSLEAFVDPSSEDGLIARGARSPSSSLTPEKVA